jgi:hypothetical protein
MRSGNSKMVGIRLRSESGEKWSVTGSRSGVFIPHTSPQDTVLITEGPTDAAAGVGLGFFTIGRPSCSGGINDLTQFIRHHRIKRAVISADNDGPGITGAKLLQPYLPVPSCLIVLPAKDLRAFYVAGGSKQLIDSIISQAVWEQPR